MTKEDLRQDFHNEQGIRWENSQGEPDIDYVEWLENKILEVKNNARLPPTSSSNTNKCDECGKELEKGTVFCSNDCRIHYYQ